MPIWEQFITVPTRSYHTLNFFHSKILCFILDAQMHMNNIGLDDTFHILSLHPELSNDYLSAQYFARISFLRIFPWGFLGRDSRNSTDLGAL